jgi:hypothetical protein
LIEAIAKWRKERSLADAVLVSEKWYSRIHVRYLSQERRESVEPQKRTDVPRDGRQWRKINLALKSRRSGALGLTQKEREGGQALLGNGWQQEPKTPSHVMDGARKFST